MNYFNLLETVLLVILKKNSWSTCFQIISLTKCCALNESYVIGSDTCKSISSNDSSIHVFQQYYPPIYSNSITSEGKLMIEVTASRIQLNLICLPVRIDSFTIYRQISSSLRTDIFQSQNLVMVNSASMELKRFR